MYTKSEETRESVIGVVKEVAKIVTEMAGIQLGDKQFSMVENRLKSRILRLGLKNFNEYLKYLVKNKESESQALLSLMTTHHTFFFREFSHFEFLLNHGLPKLIEKARERSDKTIRVFSAACSKGHEVYSLAMFFDFHLKAAAPDLKYEIWGADIDPESVKTAQNGVYRADELKQSPAMYIDGRWTRGTGAVRDFSKVKSNIRSHCHFFTSNLLNPKSYPIKEKFDVIFCRNVYIYFNQEQIKAATLKLMNSMCEHGFLFLGVSESLAGLGLKLDLIGSSVYRWPQKSTTVTAVPNIKKSKILQVLCVDDSQTVHALLGKILIPENGFKIAAKAMNGSEALEILKTKTFDVITLDLHMPELDGVGFLKQFTNKSAPVVVISSINRDDTSIAQQAISLGASDYVEKPSFENLAQAGNEIRAKLKLAVSGYKTPNSMSATTSIRSISQTASLNKIKVMIVDDSITIRSILSNLLKKDSRFEVVAEVDKPSKVEDLIQKLKPDVLTLDIHMPEMNGVELLRKIHPKYKIPTVMISSISREDGSFVLDALSAGAIDYIQKPQSSDLSQVGVQICDRLEIAARAKVKITTVRSKKAGSLGKELDANSIILLGASTGGTEALRVVLEGLPNEIPPILIVQHIPPVFSAAFAARLNELLPFEVREAKNGDVIKVNQVLIAPGGTQMGVKRAKDQLFVQVTDDAPVNRHKPSVDYLFQSVVKINHTNSIAAILTGMGADGAAGMKSLKDIGVRTIAQDQETSVVFGMPKEAIAMGGAEFTLPLQDIATKIVSLYQTRTKNTKKVG